MDFKSWLTQTKIDEPRLSDFITRLDPFFNETGFNGTEFERRISVSLRNLDTDVDKLIKPETNVENQ